MIPLLALLALLALATPALAVPVQIQGLAWLNAPACGWEGQRLDLLIEKGPIRPTCSEGLQVGVLIGPGEPADLRFVMVHEPTFRGEPPQQVVGAETRRVAFFDTAEFSLAALPDGRSRLLFGLGTGIHIYDFTLDRSHAVPPVEATPEPTTLLLLGTSLGVAGWVARRRRGR